MNSIIIFGGTFDPVHNGHLAMAEHAVTKLKAKQCIWVPNRQPLLKHDAQATIQQRLDMLDLAIENSPQKDKFLIDRCEINRDSPSYSVDTLRQFRKQFGNNQSLCLLMGEDAFAKINQWHEWESIIKLSHLIVVSRPDQQTVYPNEVKDFFYQHCQQDVKTLSQQPAGIIYPLKLKYNASSTNIRHHLINQESLNQFCPKAVADYIIQFGLYHR